MARRRQLLATVDLRLALFDALEHLDDDYGTLTSRFRDEADRVAEAIEADTPIEVVGWQVAPAARLAGIPFDPNSRYRLTVRSLAEI